MEQTMAQTVIQTVVPVAGTLIGAVIGSALTFISSREERKLMESQLNNERLKNGLERICGQYATFYKVEERYLEEIRALRQKDGRTSAAEGIRNEFRGQVYGTGAPRIEYNASSIYAELERLAEGVCIPRKGKKEQEHGNN